ncbi:hypothetical protein [Halorubrum trueperi]|uniref:Uncharacterized protein n=1 Tax=Halorubrum trueperi TaxID=2004704 RepID=A0ABD5UKL2_9EURY
MSDGSGRTTFTDGYVVPIAGLLGLLFALMAGVTAPRILSGNPADVLLPIGFAVGSLATIWFRRRYAAADADRERDAPSDNDTETATDDRRD